MIYSCYDNYNKIKYSVIMTDDTVQAPATITSTPEQFWDDTYLSADGQTWCIVWNMVAINFAVVWIHVLNLFKNIFQYVAQGQDVVYVPRGTMISELV